MFELCHQKIQWGIVGPLSNPLIWGQPMSSVAYSLYLQVSSTSGGLFLQPWPEVIPSMVTWVTHNRTEHTGISKNKIVYSECVVLDWVYHTSEWDVHWLIMFRFQIVYCEYVAVLQSQIKRIRSYDCFALKLNKEGMNIVSVFFYRRSLIYLSIIVITGWFLICNVCCWKVK